jgi:hypothetical protein
MIKKGTVGAWRLWCQMWQGLLYTGCTEKVMVASRHARRQAYLSSLERRYRKGSRGCC